MYVITEVGKPALKVTFFFLITECFGESEIIWSEVWVRLFTSDSVQDVEWISAGGGWWGLGATGVLREELGPVWYKWKYKWKWKERIDSPAFSSWLDTSVMLSNREIRSWFGLGEE